MAKKKAKKNLTISEIKKQDKQNFGEQIEIEVNGYSLKVDKVFRKTKITQLVAEIVDKFDFARENNIDLLSLLIPFVSLLILKYFTSLDIPDDLEKQLACMDILIDNNYLEAIINEIPADQMNLVFQEIGRMGDNMNLYLDNMLSTPIENKDVLLDA